MAATMVVVSNRSRHCGVSNGIQTFLVQGSQESLPSRIVCNRSLLYGAVLFSLPAPNNTTVCAPKALAKCAGPESVLNTSFAEAIALSVRGG